MSTSTTEQIGINEFRLLLSRTHVVSTDNIHSGDKGVSWDGHLVVYKNETDKKESFYGNIPVQIKTGHIDEKINRFSILKSDLKNYVKENRILYIYIVLSKSERATIFYHAFQLWDLENAIRDCGDQESKTFTFKRFPKNKKEIIDLLYEFIAESDKQKQLIPGVYSYNDLFLQKGHHVPLTMDMKFPKKTSILNLPRLIEEKAPYLRYKSEDTNIEHVVDRLSGAKIIIKFDKIGYIKCNDKIFYKNISIEGDRDSIKVNCAINLSIKISEHQILFNYNFAIGTIDDKCRLSEFLESLFTYKTFYLNKAAITLNESQVNSFKPNVIDKISFLLKYDEFRKALSISKEPDFNNATDEEFILFESLYACIIDKKAVNNVNSSNSLTIFDIFGLHLMFCSISKNQITYLLNWNDDKYVKLVNKNYPSDSLSSYYLLGTDDINYFLKIDNINFGDIESNIFEGQIDKFKCGLINNILINLISYFDITNDSKALDAAESISNHLLDVCPKNIEALLNNAQIYLRRGKVLTEEKNIEISKIEHAEKSNNLIRFACLTLMGNIDEATVLLAHISKEELSHLKKWPIFNLYKRKKSTIK